MWTKVLGLATFLLTASAYAGESKSPFAVADEGEWVRVTYSLNSPTLLYTLIYAHYNPTPYTLYPTYTSSGSWYRRVEGETSNAPPWSSPFTPLSSNYSSLGDINRQISIPGYKEFQRRLYRTRQTGEEQWKYVEEEYEDLYDSRTLYWETDGYLIDWFTP